MDDKDAERALREAVRAIKVSGCSCSLSALAEAISFAAADNLIAQSGGTLTPAKAEARIRKAIAAVVARGMN